MGEERRSLPPISEERRSLPPNQKGAALPLAVLSLTIVLSLTTALAAVGTTEPTIAVNHERSARARAAAEAGLQAALATLSAPAPGAASWAPTMAAAPFVPIPGAGAGYRAAVDVNVAGTLAERANERLVTVTGYAPSDTAPNHAVASLQAVVHRDSIMATWSAPAAIVLPAGGVITGEVDARDSSGSWCRSGRPLAGVVASPSGAISTSGSVWGPGNAVANERGPDILDGRVTAPARDAVVSALAFTMHELAALRALAAERGTLYSGHPVAARFGGESPPLPDGLVFVEGNVEVEIVDAAWTGWLIAARHDTSTGSVTFTCRPPCSGPRRDMALRGLIYAADAVAVDTPSDDRGLTVRGAIVAMQASGTPSSITPRSTADFRVSYDCDAVRGAVRGTAATTGAGLVRHGWYLKNGTYKEVSRQ